MSNYQQKDYSGSLFKNEEKKSDNHPDYSGTALVGGVEMFMDAWIKTSDSGRKWMSFSFKPKDKQTGAQRGSAPQPQRTSNRPGSAASYGSAGRPEPDDIPF